MENLWCYKTEVRQALTYAIDNQAIANELYGTDGAVAKGWSYITPSAFGYTPELDPRPYDLEKAKSMLASAGYPNGVGIPPFKIYTYGDAPIPFLPEVAQVMADSWSQLGLDVSVQVGDTQSIKDFVRDFESGGGDPGSILLNSNDSRWYALIPSVEDYGIPPVWEGRLCGEPQPDCLAIDKLLDNLPTDQGLEALKGPYTEANLAMFEAAMRGHVVTINKPWAVAPGIQWEPWPLSLDLTAIWTLDKQ
jgi:ABC-type transport system substrate-binding protein